MSLTFSSNHLHLSMIVSNLDVIVVSLEEHKSWKGTAEALAEKASSLMKNRPGFGASDFTPNERLIRDYVSRDILTRPDRKGKEAIFGFEQLVQFLACRKMLVDGWPLSKISKDFQHAEFEEILSLITDDFANNDALDLIESFKTAAPDQSGRAQARQRNLKNSASSTYGFAPKDEGDKSKTFRERQRKSTALRKIGSDFSNVVKWDFTVIQLATWVSLLIDRDYASKVTMDEAEAIGQAVTAGLLSQDSLTKESVDLLAQSTIEELERTRIQRASEEQEFKNLLTMLRSEISAEQQRLHELQKVASQHEKNIDQMKEEEAMIDKEIAQKRAELKR